MANMACGKVRLALALRGKVVNATVIYLAIISPNIRKDKGKGCEGGRAMSGQPPETHQLAFSVTHCLPWQVHFIQ